MRNNNRNLAFNIKWILILVAACPLAAMGLYLSSLPELALNRLLVKWLSIMLVILVISSAITVSVLWNRAMGEMRYREGHQVASRARFFPSPTPYRGYTAPAQGYGDWPPTPPPEQRPQLRMLPDNLFGDMRDVQ